MQDSETSSDGCDVRSRSVKVPDQGCLVARKFIKEQGFQVFKQNGRVNPHACAAACRVMALITVYEQIQNSEGATLLSYYGTGHREQRVADRFSAAKDVAKFLTVSFGQWSWNNDVARRFTRTNVDQPGTDALLMDVYHIDVPVLLELCAAVHRFVYVAVHRFDGYVGAEVYCDKVEGSWYRHPEGAFKNLISFFPDAHAMAYPAHPDVNWLFDNSIPELAVSHVACFGPNYHLLRLCRRPGTVPPGLGPSYIEHKIVDYVDFNLNTLGDVNLFERLAAEGLWQVLADWFRPAWNLRKLVCLPVATKVARISGMKPQTGYRLDIINSEVDNEMAKHPAMRQLELMNPSLYAEVREYTFLYAQYGERKERISRAVRLRALTESQDRRLRDMRDGRIEPASFLRAWQTVGSLGAILGMGFILMRFQRPACLVSNSFSRTLKHPLIPVLGGFAEELVRGAYPVASIPLWLFDTLQASRSGLASLIGVGAIHLLGYCLPLPWAIAIHVAYNCYAVYSQRSEPRARAFLAAYAEGATYRANAVIPFAYTLPAFSNRRLPSCVPEVGSFAVLLDRHRVDTQWALDREGRTYPGLHPVLITNGILWRPANSISNAITALVLRLHKATKNTITEEGREAFLRSARELVKHLQPHANDNFPSLDSCAQHFAGMKKRRFLDACAKLANGDLQLIRKVHVKTDETLNQKQNLYDLKPRTIINCDPTFQALTMPFARWYSDLLKCGNGLPWPSDVTFQYYYCSGKTGDDLTATMHAHLAENRVNCVTVFVAGDDCMVHIVNPLGNSWWLVMDFAQFDQTQSESIGSDGRRAVYSPFVGDEAVINAFVSMLSGSYRLRSEGFEIFGSTGFTQATGSSDTTVWNSTVNICFWHSAASDLLSSRPDQMLELAHKKAQLCGFELTGRIIEGFDPIGADFLKGWFVPGTTPVCDTNLVWIPLPSLCLKIGKLGRPVQEIYSSINAYCYAVSRSVIVPDDYPILGAFMKVIKRFAKVGSWSPLGDPDFFENPYKMMNRELVIINRSAVEDLIADRYSLDANQVRHCEGLLDSVTELPCLVCHDVFVALRDVDY